MRKLLLGAGALVVAAIAAFALWAWERPIDPVAPPATFDAAVVARGAKLAALAGCASCHTVEHAPPFAGGVALATPFGTIYGSNVTPDAATGIGRWSEVAFTRAMREGVGRDGRHLYPAFPYDHFTRISDADLQALYAFLMTRTPVRHQPPPNRLVFPFGFRPLIAGWKLLFLDRGAAPAADRGAYVVEALAHCSSCHTPRNAFGAERAGRAFAGARVEGWYAPPLNAASPSPLPWTVDALTTYLRTGIAPGHAIAAGPMQDVVAGLARADEGDVRAVAAYVTGLMGTPGPERLAVAAASERRAAAPLAERPVGADDARLALGAAVYASACAACHDAGRGVGSNGALPMPLAVAVRDADPRSLLRIVRQGVTPPAGTGGRWMPAFGAMLTDEQLGALAAWLRRGAADAPPWPDLAEAVRETREASR